MYTIPGQALCHGLHVEVRGEHCRVSFLLHLYAGSVDEIQGTGLCSFVSVVLYRLMKLAISATLSGQQTRELPVLGL